MVNLSLSNLSSLFLSSVGSPLSQAKTPISSFPVSLSLCACPPPPPPLPTQSTHPSTSCTPQAIPQRFRADSGVPRANQRGSEQPTEFFDGIFCSLLNIVSAIVKKYMG
ncbi:hypothetical protein VPH35_088563 [Triticum aestivum]